MEQSSLTNNFKWIFNVIGLNEFSILDYINQLLFNLGVNVWPMLPKRLEIS